MARKSLRVEIDESLHTKIRIKSAFTGKTATDVCREALRKWVDEDHPIILPPKSQPTGKITE